MVIIASNLVEDPVVPPLTKTVHISHLMKPEINPVEYIIEKRFQKWISGFDFERDDFYSSPISLAPRGVCCSCSEQFLHWFLI